jgi:GNAT superfamily N-acetyltransferase
MAPAATGVAAVTGLLDRPAAVGPPIDGLVDIRPARAGDVPAVRAFLVGLSLDSAYRRFFTGVGAPSAAFVRHFVEVDHDRRETRLALLGDDVIGIADCARHDDRRTVELGLVVADAWQRLGLGPQLAQKVIDFAVDRGARTLLVHALADNSRVARMLRRRWPGCRPTFEDGTLVWHLPLV